MRRVASPLLPREGGSATRLAESALTMCLMGWSIPSQVRERLSSAPRLGPMGRPRAQLRRHVLGRLLPGSRRNADGKHHVLSAGREAVAEVAAVEDFGERAPELMSDRRAVESPRLTQRCLDRLHGRGLNRTLIAPAGVWKVRLGQDALGRPRRTSEGSER